MATDKRFVVKNGLQTENINFVYNDAVLGSANITATMLSSNTLSFSGSTGQLFSITDSMTGVIFAVNDISGVPSIEVYDDGRIRMAEGFGNVIIGNSAINTSRASTSTTTGILQVAGGAGIEGNINVGGTVNLFTGNVGIGTTSPTANLFVQGTVDATGHVAIGNNATVDYMNQWVTSAVTATPASSILMLQDSITGNLSATGMTSYSEIRTRSEYIHTGTTSTNVTISGAAFNTGIGSTSTGPIASMLGFYPSIKNYGSGNISNFYVYYGRAEHAGSGTVSTLLNAEARNYISSSGSVSGTAYNFDAYTLLSGSGNIATNVGLSIFGPSATGSGRITGTNYGVRISAQNTSAVTGNAYNLYSEGLTAKNILEGQVGIGTTVISSGARLMVTGGNISLNPTGSATGYGIVFPDGTFQTTAAAAATSVGGAGTVQYSGGAGAFDGDALNFFWDSANKRLGIGTNVPSNTLSVWGSTPGFFGTTNGTDVYEVVIGNTAVTSTTIGYAASAVVPYGYITATASAAKNITFNGLGFVGIGGSTQPKNTLDVAGGMVVGSSYAGSAIYTAPVNGLGVQGSVGVGTNNPLSTLDVNGWVGIRQGLSAAGTATVNALVSNGAVSGTGATFTSLQVSGTTTTNALVSNGAISGTGATFTSLQVSGTATVNALSSNGSVSGNTAVFINSVYAGALNSGGAVIANSFTSNGAISGQAITGTSGTFNSLQAGLSTTTNILVSNVYGRFGQNVSIGSDNVSISTTTGALVVGTSGGLGGIGLAGNINAGGQRSVFSGNVAILGSNASTSSTTGALIITNGVGIGGNINAGGSVHSFQGSVGIGTTLPNSPLQVAGSGKVAQFGNAQTSQTYLRINPSSGFLDIGVTVGSNNLYTGSTDGEAYITAQSDKFTILGSSTPRLSMIAGNVGIATTVPGSTLDVNGNASFRSAISVAGAASVSSLVSNGAISGTTINGTAATFTSLQNSGTETVNALVSNVYGLFGQNLTVNSTNVSTSTSTGALVVAGGAGLAGNINVGGYIQMPQMRMYSFTRTIPTVVGDAVDLGSATLANGGGMFEISVVVPSSSFSVSKYYILPINFSETATWTVAQPISDGGPYSGNDFDVDVNVSTNVASFRIRRTAGTTAGTAYVTIKQSGTTLTFVESTATATVTAPAAYYNAAVLRQVDGRVGIGTAAPGFTLDVYGTLKFFNYARGNDNGSAYIVGSAIGTDTPVYSFIGSTGTGMAGISSNAGLKFIVNSGEKVRISQDGTVGIGTTAAGSLLDVNGIASIRSAMSVAGATAVASLNVNAGIYANTLNVNSTANVNALTSNTGITVSGGGITVTGVSQFTGNVNITGNINVTGAINTQNANVLVVQNPIIYIGEDNAGNLFDMGLVASYTSTSYYHTGLVRNHNDGAWSLFDTLPTEPNVSTGQIDWSNASITYGLFKAGNVNIVGNADSTSSTSGALVINGIGGIGVGGNINVGGLQSTFSNKVTVGTSSPGTATFTVSSGTATMDLRNGNFGWWRMTSSSSSNAGTFRIDSQNSSYTPISANGDALTLTLGGYVGVGVAAPVARLQVLGNLWVNSSNASTSTSTGAIRTEGGVGIGGNVNVGGTTNYLAGNVGIGINPSYRLQVSGSAGTVAYFTGGTDSGAIFASGGLVGLTDPAGNNGFIFNSASNYAYVQTSGSEKMRVTSAGFVGIGTAIPNTRLAVSDSNNTVEISPGSTNTLQSLTRPTGAYVDLSIKGRDIIFTANNTESMRISNNGAYVGIGTITPGSVLDVNGNASFRSAVSVAGTATVNALVSNTSVTAANYLVTTGSSTEASGLAIQRVIVKSNVAAGELYQLAEYTDTEGDVAFEIQVSSETSGNSGTSTYRFQGGFSVLPGSYYRLMPFNDGRGHGNGPDNGYSSTSWEVYIYGSTVSGSAYTYGIAVYVPVGAVTKNLVTTITELKRGMTYNDKSGNAVVTSPTITSSIYSQRNLMVENRIGAGTVAPGSTLDVNGVASFRSAISVAGTATVSSLVSNGAISGTTINGTAGTLTSLQVSGTTTTNALVSNVYGLFGQNVTVNSTNAATSSTTGALVVAGGVGINGAVITGSYGLFGQNVTVNSTNASTTTSTGALILAGGAGIAGNINVGGVTNYFAGNIGVGVTAPLARVHLRTASGGTVLMRFDDGVATRNNYIGIDNYEQLVLSADEGATAGATPVIKFRTTGVERMRIDGTGNVGIGSTVSIAGSLFVRDLTVNAAIQTAGTLTVNALVSNVYGLFGQNVTINSANASTSTTTGALIVAGGVGIGGNINAGGQRSVFSGNIAVLGSNAATSSTTGALIVTNGVGIGGDLYTGGAAIVGSYMLATQNVRVSSTNAATSSTTGALVVSGGAGIAGNVYAGGNVVAASFQPTASSIPPNGMYLPATNTIAFSTAGTEDMRLTPNGNLLIGTTSTPAGSTATVVLQGVGTNGSGIEFSNVNVAGANIGIGGSNSLVFSTYTGAVGSEAYTERMRMDRNGNVGIGTTLPISPLSVGTTVGVSVTTYPAIIAGSDGTIAVQATSTSGYSGINMLNQSGTLAASFQYGNSGTAAALAGHFFFGNRGTGNTYIVSGVAATIRVAVTNGGNLLVGTTSTPAGGTATMVLQGTGTNGSGIEFSNVNVAGANIGIGGSNSLVFSTYTGAVGSETYTERMRMDASGSIGIGTSVITSGTKLMVVGGNINLSPTGSATGYGIVFPDGTFMNTATSSGGTSSGISGTVQFSDGAGGFLGDANNFFWDNTNDRLGIGTSSPTNTLSVWGATPGWFRTTNGVDVYEVVIGNTTATSTTIGYSAASAPLAYGYLTATASAAKNITFNASGYTGIGGSTQPKNTLDVAGSMVVGGNYAGNAVYSPPANSLGVQGKVGVSTSNPISELDVNGIASIRSAMSVAGTAVVNTLVSNVYGLFGQNVTINSTNASTSTTTGALVLGGGAGIAGNVTVGGSVHSFQGSVGVGAVSPVSQLHLTTDAAATNRGLTIDQHNTGVQAALANFRKSRGTLVSPTTVANGDYTGAFTFQNYDGSAYRVNAGFGARITGTVASNSVPTDLYFWAGSTDDADPYANNTIKMLITSAGRVGIGTSSPGSTFDVNGIASIRSAMSVAGTASVSSLVSNGAISGTTINGTAGTFTSLQNSGTETVNALVSNVYGLFGQNVTVNSTNASISSATGALVVAGGVGVGGNLNVGGSVNTFTGNVGIGSTLPISILNIRNPVGTTTALTISADSGGANAELGRIDFHRFFYDPTGVSARISSYREGGAQEGALTFSTNPSTVAGQQPIERMRINSTGYVGIGTNVPDSILDVRQTTNTTVHIGRGSGQGVLFVDGPSGTNNLQFLHNGAAGYITQTGGSSGFQFRNTAGDYTFSTGAGNTERIRILGSNGNILVNTSSTPAGGTATMVVQGVGTNAPGIEFSNVNVAGANIALGGSNSLVFSTYTGAVGSETYTERMRLDSGGNFAIGTPTAAGKLTVVNAVDDSRIIYARGTTAGIRIGSNASGGFVEGVDASGGTSSYQPLNLGGSTLVSYTGGTERARIDATGNVGIGSTMSVAGSMFVRDLTVNAAIQSAGTLTVNALISNVYGRFGQNVTINSSNASTSGTTGALVVAGGVGIGGNINVTGSDSEFTGKVGIGTTSTGANAAIVYNSLDVSGNIDLNSISGRSSGIYFADGTYQTTAVINQLMSTYEYTGDGVTTIYSTSPSVANGTTNTMVFVNGVYQLKNTYTWSGTSLTFSSAPVKYALISINIIGSVAGSGTTSIIGYQSVSGNTALSPTAPFAIVSGNVTVTLPSATTSPGQMFYVKNIGTGNVVVNAINSETIDGNPSLYINSRWSTAGLLSNGSNWFIF